MKVAIIARGIGGLATVIGRACATSKLMVRTGRRLGGFRSGHSSSMQCDAGAARLGIASSVEQAGNRIYRLEICDQREDRCRFARHRINHD